MRLRIFAQVGRLAVSSRTNATQQRLLLMADTSSFMVSNSLQRNLLCWVMCTTNSVLLFLIRSVMQFTTSVTLFDCSVGQRIESRKSMPLSRSWHVSSLRVDRQTMEPGLIRSIVPVMPSASKSSDDMNVPFAFNL